MGQAMGSSTTKFSPLFTPHTQAGVAGQVALMRFKSGEGGAGDMDGGVGGDGGGVFWSDTTPPNPVPSFDRDVSSFQVDYGSPSGTALAGGGAGGGGGAGDGGGGGSSESVTAFESGDSLELELHDRINGAAKASEGFVWRLEAPPHQQP